MPSVADIDGTGNDTHGIPSADIYRGPSRSFMFFPPCLYAKTIHITFPDTFTCELPLCQYKFSPILYRLANSVLKQILNFSIRRQNKIWSNFFSLWNRQRISAWLCLGFPAKFVSFHISRNTKQVISWNKLAVSRNFPWSSSAQLFFYTKRNSPFRWFVIGTLTLRPLLSDASPVECRCVPCTHNANAESDASGFNQKRGFCFDQTVVQ
jgi:hypothetical protein